MSNENTTRLPSKSIVGSRPSIKSKLSLAGRASFLGRNSISYKQILLEQQYQLPENFHMKILCLEDDLERNKITNEQLVELINLYSVLYLNSYNILVSYFIL